MEMEWLKIRPEMARTLSKLAFQYGIFKVDTENPFLLKSGKKSPTYLDWRVAASPPELANLIAAYGFIVLDDLEKSGKKIDTICGGVTAGVPYAKDLAKLMRKDFAYVREEKKEHGKKAQVEPERAIKGKNCVLCEDLITDGGSKITFIEGIREAGGSIDACLCVFDREQGGRKTLAKLDVELYSLCDFTTLLEVAEGYLDEKTMKAVKEYLANQ